VHAVVTHVTITGDEGAAESQLREQVVPAVSQAPGFVAGYWARKEKLRIGDGRLRVGGRRPGHEREGPVDGS
jgi:hypothetical protein